MSHRGTALQDEVDRTVQKRFADVELYRIRFEHRSYLDIMSTCNYRNELDLCSDELVFCECWSVSEPLMRQPLRRRRFLNLFKNSCTCSSVYVVRRLATFACRRLLKKVPRDHLIHFLSGNFMISAGENGILHTWIVGRTRFSLLLLEKMKDYSRCYYVYNTLHDDTAR